MTDAVKESTHEKMVTLTIDGIEASVPEGFTVVDAARRVGVDIPVFCYHPKMEPVGMCRMCLVDIGLPERDRATGEVVMEKGKPKIQFGRTLQTGCTVRVAEGMVVVGYTEKVQKARTDMLEFLLTSHPLDCPICDKGGECPLQNLTMGFGPGQTRFIFDEKIKLDKHVPLGELIWLDRERCIQCARCTRFQSEIADDPVIGFEARGRSLQIVTYSEPGFDSYWSGNTSDICPVGALTTNDFRFGARPWELQASASLCAHCAVNCNTTLNTRRDAKAGGEMVVKRVMPRQNELVNEIWICDKGRFAHHFAARDEGRLTQPMVRSGGSLRPVSWEAALKAAAEGLGKAGKNLFALAGGRLSNEDYINLQQLVAHKNAGSALYSQMAGGDLVAQLGVGVGTNLSDLRAGDAVLVIASDLEEEGPLWWLRVKQAAVRGVTLVVANPRNTKLERYAQHQLRYAYGEEAALAMALVGSLSSKAPAAAKSFAGNRAVKDAGKALAEANNLIVFYGSEGTSLASSSALARACANLLIATGHTGRANNGLLAVWDKGNAQGAWDMGLRPSEDLAGALSAAKAAYIVGADPAGDDPALAKALKSAGFLVVQDIRMSATAEMADVVLPAAAFTEREGTLTNGERRVQRFYPAVPAPAGVSADFAVTAQLTKAMGLELESRLAGKVFAQIAASYSDYDELNYTRLAEVTEQWPILGRDDVYYGGTSYNNSQGLGVQLASAAERGESVPLAGDVDSQAAKAKGLLAVPVTRLYDHGSTVTPSEVLAPRLAHPLAVFHPDDAKKNKIAYGKKVTVTINGVSAKVTADLDSSLPKGVVLIPRSMGLPLAGPTEMTVKAG